MLVWKQNELRVPPVRALETRFCIFSVSKVDQTLTKTKQNLVNTSLIQMRICGLGIYNQDAS